MFHLGDKVEEISTKRPGKIDSASESRDHRGKLISGNGWRVIVMDGKQPLYHYFKDPNEFRLVSCPHADSGGQGFVPDRGIME